MKFGAEHQNIIEAYEFSILPFLIYRRRRVSRCIFNARLCELIRIIADDFDAVVSLSIALAMV